MSVHKKFTGILTDVTEYYRGSEYERLYFEEENDRELLGLRKNSYISESRISDLLDRFYDCTRGGDTKKAARFLKKAETLMVRFPKITQEYLLNCATNRNEGLKFGSAAYWEKINNQLEALKAA